MDQSEKFTFDNCCLFIIAYSHSLVSMLPSLMARMVSFGVEEFAKEFGNLKPAQFVDIIALAGDKSDNIPGNTHLLYPLQVCF